MHIFTANCHRAGLSPDTRVNIKENTPLFYILRLKRNMASEWIISVSEQEMNGIMDQFISNRNQYSVENPIIISDDEENDLHGKYNNIYFRIL